MRPALIVGGGPAGSAAATILAGAGREVILFERSAAPTDKVCGDFLSAEAITALQGFGLDLAALSPVPIRRLRLLHDGRLVEIMLPFQAYGLTRRILDEALLRLAASAGVNVVRGRTVRSVRPACDRLMVRIDGMPEALADTVFLATGKHDLHDTPRPGRASGAIGLKMYFRLSPAQDLALGDAIELMLFAGGYAGLQRVAAERAVLCMTFVRDRLRAGSAKWPAVLRLLQAECPHLATRLTAAEPVLAKPLAIAGTPYGFVYRPEPMAPPGLFRLGDQACVIPSLTGDGVAIALHSARLAADICLGSGNAAALYHQRLRQRLRWQMQLATALQRVCVRPGLQAALLTLCGFCPAIPALAARWTRLRADPAMPTA
jgi:flavin-dependent dehydrogenase